MKVGLFMPSFTPEVGGGHTFEADIHQSLVELASESRHEFVVLVDGGRLGHTDPGTSSNRLHYVAYSPPHVIERIMDRVSLDMVALQGTRKRPSKLDHLARQAGIEFMWFVGPGPMQLDVPYMTIVWDLQHRLQPWFPEVSAGGTWDMREITLGRFLRRASVVIAGTKTGQQEIERFYQLPPERIKVLPHPTPGFALKAIPSDGRYILEKYSLPPSYIFYPAQFWPHKNHANLLLAMRELRDNYDLDLSLVLVGSDKGNLPYVRYLVNELNLASQVHFLGFVPQDDLIALYRNAFALTYVTFFGPENLPPLEAFALGCPVVASNVPGAQEQLGEAAMLVDPRSPEQIASVIKFLYDDTSFRQKLIERGFVRAAQWTGYDFVQGALSILDDFATVRHCWGNNRHSGRNPD